MRSDVFGPFLVLLSALLYAIGNVFAKTLYNHQMSQVTVFLYRAVLTFFVNAGLAQAASDPKTRSSACSPAIEVLTLATPSRRTSALALVRGCAAFAQVLLLNLAFDLTVSVADAFAVKEALGTLLTVVTARLLLGSDERLSAHEIAGVFAVLCGLLLIAQPPAFFSFMKTVEAPSTATLPRWSGFAMLIVAACMQTVQNLLTRMLSKAGGASTVSPAILLSYYMFALGVCSAVAAAVYAAGTPSDVSGAADASRHWAQLTPPRSSADVLLLLGVVLAGTFGQLANAAGARTTTASKVALLAINELAFAYICSVTVLNEPTSVLSAVGTAVIFLGSALVAAGSELAACIRCRPCLASEWRKVTPMNCASDV